MKIDQLAGRDLALNGVEKADQLLISMPLHAAADDLAVEHVQGGEQDVGAVALIVVDHGAAPSALERHTRLRPVMAAVITCSPAAPPLRLSAAT